MVNFITAGSVLQRDVIYYERNEDDRVIVGNFKGHVCRVRLRKILSRKAIIKIPSALG